MRRLAADAFSPGRMAEFRPWLEQGFALCVGGMGARDVNFHNDHMRCMGYTDVAERIQDLFLAGREEVAIAAVPAEYVDERCLVEPASRIRERYAAWADSGITGLCLDTSQPQALELLAQCAREHPARGMEASGAPVRESP